jgi:hypothetical protein
LARVTSLIQCYDIWRVNCEQVFVVSYFSKKIVYTDNFLIKNDMEFTNHIGKLYFNKAIKIEFDKPYTIGIIFE